MSQTILKSLLAMLFALCASSALAQMPNPYGAPISLENAKKAVAAAEAEAIAIVVHEARAIVVGHAREASAFRHVAEPDAGLHQRQHRRADARPVHLLERARGRPVGHPVVAAPGDRRQIFRRHDVVVHVDALPARRCLRP